VTFRKFEFVCYLKCCLWLNRQYFKFVHILSWVSLLRTVCLGMLCGIQILFPSQGWVLAANFRGNENKIRLK
jgi:hypothetical protein